MKNKLLSKILISIMLLSIISIYNIYLSKYININNNILYLKQIIYLLLGITLIFIIKKLNINLFKYHIFLYIISIILLIITLLYARPINNSRSWLDLKFFMFQPSELVKFTLPLTLLSIKKKNEFIYIFKLILLTLIPSILVFLEPDTGSVIYYILILLLTLFFKKLNKKTYICLTIILITSILTLLILYKLNLLNNLTLNYRIDRIININNNYQIINSLICIGSAKLINLNLNNYHFYIPEAHNDFIYSFIIGNNGLIIGILILILYYYLFYILYKNIILIKNKKYKYLCLIYLYLLIFQIIYNICMNMGLFPIMGITLPFLSYGGTSTIINFLCLSVIINKVYNH